MISAAVYGDFHPDGRYGVFSSNVIIPMFHTESNRRLEVYDTVSDLAVADFDGNRMILSPLTADSTVLETFPTFSADGKWIYYCSAPTVPLPDSVQQLRYSLCRIAFDANHGAWGDRVDTLWNARLEKGSVCHPKASPDGRYLLYTVADYGTFPIWHRETELQLMDLQTAPSTPCQWSTPAVRTLITVGRQAAVGLPLPASGVTGSTGGFILPIWMLKGRRISLLCYPSRTLKKTI